jgi:hypothetical protein
MSQSRTLFIGMDGHQDAIAVASVAHDHGAEVLSLGPIGTRQCDIAQLLRKRPSQATPLVFVSAAGPCGSWLSRSLTNKDSACWGVAPSLMPKKAGDRVTTDRRDAVQLAVWLARGLAPRSLSPQGKTQRCATAAGPVKRPSALSRPPRAGSPPASSDTLSAPRAGPPGAQPLSGGSRQWSARHRRNTASFKVTAQPGEAVCTAW